MSVIFADTFYFLGLLNPDDHAHQRCVQFAATFRGEAITTEYVLVEVADALCAPGQRHRTAEFISQIQAGGTFRVIPASEVLLRRGLELFRRRLDKDWPLTDCISFVVMGDAGATEAATGDQHFVQAGFRALL